MRWLDYPFYRFIVFFVLGILLGHYLEISLEFWLPFVGISFLLSIAFFFWKPFKGYSKLLFTSFVLLFFLGLGGAVMILKSDVLPSNHFVKSVVKGEDALLELQLREQLSSNQYNHRFYADVTRIDSTQTTGKVLVLFRRADSVKFIAGDQLIVYDDINDASDSRNPGDFNYKEYLESIDVYGQVYVDKPRILNTESNQSSLPWYVKYRNQLLHNLKQTNLTPNSRSMVEALVLGQRQNVDPIITKNFRDAGVIHILALSGLHVGIILLILQFALRWMQSIRYGKILQTVLIIILLWCFALITGMSPSILRAVTMFSFVAIGMSMNRKRSVFHSLTISAFFLLLFDPRLLFQVGFQLSYTAVLAIVLLQPLFARALPRIKFWLPRKLWEVFTVTLAAQIGVAPLSIFYFHQLPMAFLVGNLALLLFLPLILVAAIIFIVTMQLGIPNVWLGDGLNLIFENIIAFIGYISSFKSFVLTDLYIEPVEVILIYIILLSSIIFLRPAVLRSRRERFKIMRVNNGLHITVLGIILLVAFGTMKFLNTNDNFLILHQSRGSAIAITNAQESRLLTHFPSMDAERRLNSFSRLSQMEFFKDTKLKIDSLPAQIHYLDTDLFVIDESTAYLETDVEHPIVLLSNSPKINLDQVITKMQPKLIITDGSNYRNFVERWQKTCLERNVAFINTYESGAINLLNY